MKQLILGLLIISPMTVAAHQITIANRTIAGSKCATQTLLAGYLAYTGWQVASTCLERFAQNRVDNGLISAALFYTSYRLGCGAWKNAKRALGKE